jgi:hypothetical protein
VCLPRLCKIADDEQRDMVAARARAVAVEAEKPRRARDDEARLLTQFAQDALGRAFAGIDAAARQIPARHISVAHEADAILPVDHQRPRAERHAAPKEAGPQHHGLGEPGTERARRHGPAYTAARRSGQIDGGRSRLTKSARPDTEDTVAFLLAHLSDAHLGPLVRPRLRELAGKRLTGFLNWTRGRSGTHDMEVLGRLVDDLLDQRPDHIAVTGDLVNIALPGEFALARRFMEGLGAPHDVSFVPGNHDAYVRSALPLVARTFAPWITDDMSGEPAYPFVRRRGDVALIGVSSGVPTAPLLASGRLGDRQRRELGQRLDAARKEGLARIVLIHHPPHRTGASPARGLTDARECEALLRRHGADLIIHGHNHKFSVSRIDGAEGPGIPVVGAASASAAGGTRTHRAAYNLYEISVGTGGVRIAGRIRGLLDDRRTIGDLGSIPL